MMDAASTVASSPPDGPLVPAGEVEPIRARRVFRLFVSSTFDDFKAERACLQRDVFPVLDALCRSFGAIFQPIDLRWGVSEEAGLDHRTLEVCLTEVDRCLAQTIRPNFLVMMGDRYGWQPLPAALDEALLVRLLEAEPRSSADAELLSRLYRIDHNHVPPRALLQPRSGALRDPIAWAGVERSLRDALVRRVHAAQAQDEDFAARLSWSATHQEVQRGVLDRDNVRGVVALVRTALESPTPAEDAQTRLVAEVSRRVEADNCIHLECGSEEAYLPRFRSAVTARLEHLIRAELVLTQVDPQRLEEQAHRGLRSFRSQAFLGRQAEIDQLLGLTRDAPTGPVGRIAVVEGGAGTGKTSLLAKFVHLAGEADPEALIVDRYVGTTADSSDPSSLLLSICAQLRRAARQAEPEQRPASLRAAAAEVQRLLGEISYARPVIIVIDALDQLQAHQSADWVPDAVPARCLLVVSVVRGSNVANDLALRDVALRIPLAPLLPGEAEQLVQRLLRDSQRCVTPDQAAQLHETLAAGATALEAQVIAELARGWRSWDVEVELAHDGPSRFEQLLMSIEAEARHGAVLAGAALGLLAASRFGLAEDELLDLLSTDEDVMADFRRRFPYSPAVERLPQSVFSRLIDDLKVFLTTAAIDGVTVHSFYHRTLQAACETRYLHEGHRAHRHRQLAQYFSAQPNYFVDPAGADRTVNRRRMTEALFQWIAAGEYAGAAEMLGDFEYLLGRLETNRVDDLATEVAQVCAALPEPNPAAERVSAVCARFAGRLRRGTERWPADRILVQLLSDTPSALGLDAELDATLSAGLFERHWLRRSWPARADGVVAELHAAGALLTGVASIDDTRLVTLSDDGWLQCWEWSRGRLVASTRLPGNACDVALSRDGSALRYRVADRWQTLDSQRLVLSAHEEHEDSAWSALVSPDPRAASRLPVAVGNGWTVELLFIDRYLHQQDNPFYGLALCRKVGERVEAHVAYNLPANVAGLIAAGSGRWVVWTADAVVQVWDVKRMQGATEPAYADDPKAAVEQAEQDARAALSAGALLLPDLTFATYAPARVALPVLRYHDLETGEKLSETIVIREEDPDSPLVGAVERQWVTGSCVIDGLTLSWGRSDAVSIWHPGSPHPLRTVRIAGQFEILAAVPFWFAPSTGTVVPRRSHDPFAGHVLFVALLTSRGLACMYNAHTNQGAVFHTGRQTGDPTANYARRYEQYGFDVLADGRLAMRWRDDAARVWDIKNLAAAAGLPPLLVHGPDRPAIRDVNSGHRHSQSPASQVAKVKSLSDGGLLVQLGSGLTAIAGADGSTRFQVPSDGFAEEIEPGWVLVSNSGPGDAAASGRLALWDLATASCVALSAPLAHRITRAIAFNTGVLTVDAGRTLRLWDRQSLVLIDACPVVEAAEAKPAWQAALDTGNDDEDLRSLAWNAWASDRVVGLTADDGKAQAVWHATTQLSLIGLEAQGRLLCLGMDGEAFALELMKGARRMSLAKDSQGLGEPMRDEGVARCLAERCLRRARIAHSLGWPGLAAKDYEGAIGLLRWSADPRDTQLAGWLADMRARLLAMASAQTPQA